MDDKFPLALPAGTVLAGQYVIQKALGQGGFGITYMALDHNTNEKVAVKEFFPDTLATRTQTTVTPYTGERGESFSYGMSCFLQEAETLAEFIGNKNIVKIHSYFEENGTAYFVMDFVEGISFDRYIKDNGGKVSYEEAERILVCVMDALAAVHKKGIIHRDVTPDNIYITSDGTVKLLDFGAARYSLGDKSRSLDVVLKHGFAPKEQYTRHGRQGPYTDVYSLGASFYFAITGKRPPDSIDRLEDDDLVPPSSLGVSIPRDKEDAILKAMSVQPSDRFQSMDSFKSALMGVANVTPDIQSTSAQGIEVQQRIFTPQDSYTDNQSVNGFNQVQNAAEADTPSTAYIAPDNKSGQKKKRWIMPVLAGAVAIVVILFIAILVNAISSGKKTGKTVDVSNDTSTAATTSAAQSSSGSTKSTSSSSSKTPTFGSFNSVVVNNVTALGHMNVYDKAEWSYIPGSGLVYYDNAGKGSVIYKTTNAISSINVVPNSDKVYFINPDEGREDSEAAALTSFLGMHELENVDYSVRPLPLKPGDVLLACSDGVGGVLDEGEVLTALGCETPELICKQLEENILMYRRKNQDNYTAIVVKCI